MLPKHANAKKSEECCRSETLYSLKCMKWTKILTCGNSDQLLPSKEERTENNINKLPREGAQEKFWFTWVFMKEQRVNATNIQLLGGRSILLVCLVQNIASNYVSVVEAPFSLT